ncbi:uncharacterized protein LOC125776714 [Bactrocera dorsalis]|uniref:Uncharacterized protein LOC125776714 n=1 Tax=Bactrocera dorsalis TaxID=27457 RepID=A0ABM3JAG7_BACDO|nr:uncharacterized protein LOC125776714 [Bactrocera dorsalis]
MNSEVAPPAKRKRQQPNKKWKESEVHSIIEFLMEEPEFEAPTAQLFYKRFLRNSQLDVSWDLVRWKVRHLKAQYRKANDWLASTGAGLQDEADGSTIEAKIAKMCPYYDQLREIFEKRLPVMQPLLVESNLPSPQLCPVSPAPEFEAEFLEECVPAAPSNAASSIAPISTPVSTCQRSNTHPPKSSIGQLAAIQAEKIAMEAKKLEFDKYKFEEEKKIQEKKLDIESKKLEIELKK